MTAPDAWPEYAEALWTLHATRQGAVQEARAAQQADARRSGELAGLAERLGRQRQALIELAVRLRAPLRPEDLAPAPTSSAGPGAEGPAGVGDLRAAVDAADAALGEARHVATLPRLLPGWNSRFARAAVVYAAFGVPSLLLTVLLSLAGVHGNRSVLVWFAFVWPAVAALLGGLVVQRVSRPPLDGDPAALGGDPAALGGTAPPGSSAVEQRVELLLRGSRRERHHVYRWFGVLVAWAGWLVPGVVLDWFGSLWPG